MIRNCLIPLLIIFTPFNLKAQSHFIGSFSPTSGPVGSTVVINGAGFNPVADSNQVLFGHLKAPIISASATSLTVTVPSKATYNYITVVTQTQVGASINNYSAVSNLPFDVLFEDDNIIAINAFNVETIVSDTAHYGVAVGDFDGDGKLDYATGNTKFRNISIDTPAFASPVYTPLSFTGPAPYTNLIERVWPYKKCEDYNNDGLPDLFADVILDSLGYTYTRCFYSVAGHFDSVVTSGRFYGFNNGASFPDFNNDGRKDRIYFGSSGSGHGLHAEISGGDFLMIGWPVCHSFYCADLDGDGYKDIVAGFNDDFAQTKAGLAFIKTSFQPSLPSSLLGNISDIDFHTPSAEKPYSINGGDFNGDGKIDLVVGVSGQGVCLLINSSTPGTMSFLPHLQFTGMYYNNIKVTDMNGDGKPDIIAQEYFPASGYSNFIYKNTSTGNNISFSDGVALPNDGYYMDDFDGDGKVDFLVLNGNKISVLRHNPISNRKLCPAANVSFNTSVTGTAFQWQFNTGSGFSNISDNAIYSGTTTAALQVSNIPSSYYGYEYRCLVDNNPCGQFKVTFENKWQGSISNAWESAANWSCGAIPDANTDVVINSGTVILNASTTIRSLTVNPPANFTVATSAILTITH